MEGESIRIDKWLWSVRLFKTRTMASDACRGGKVKLSGIPVKPSHVVQIGEVYQVSQGPLTRSVKVLELLNNRVSAKIVPEFMEDMTPAEEIEKIRMMKELNYERWDQGAGRPTKKDRRQIARHKGL